MSGRTDRVQEVLCRNCWHWFERRGTRGPVPTWCSSACTQAAYRARIKRRQVREFCALLRVAS